LSELTISINDENKEKDYFHTKKKSADKFMYIEPKKEDAIKITFSKCKPQSAAWRAQSDLQR